MVSTLWADSVAYQSGREYVVTIDCIGDRLSGYIDGVQIFAVTDESFATGRIGLYASGNAGATFRQIMVGALQWNAYYAFSGESMLPAGSRLRIFSGNASNAPAAADNVSHRFAAGLGDPGTRHFGSDAVDLRLVDSHENVVHARRFFAPLNYAAVNAKVIRRADGTGLVIVVPAANAPGTALPPGQYRMNLTYLRDNTAASSASQVLSENGSTQPEVVALDVPWITPDRS